MSNHISGKSFLITGGSSGFGLETARILLERGGRVAITGRDQTKLAAAADQLPGVLAIRADACSTADWRSALDLVRTRFGRVDALVNNHGAGVRIAPLAEQDDDAIDAALSINLGSVLRGCREAIAIMRPMGCGHIVNVASVCAQHAWPGWGPYTAAKAGLVVFTRVLHLEMQPWGGKATAFIPGAARSGFCAAAGLDDSWQKGLPDASDIASELVKTLDVPPHVFVEGMTVWGTAQVLNPF